MNKTQKLILAIFVPIIIFFIAIFIVNEAVDYESSILFNLGETWYVWLVYSASCCLFEFLLFRDNKIITQKK
ncbi:unnamed protein product [marine sediment metagenome]|uniref:Uncharacterized protein n=1 Tax=marine sediment metagenome TaxID=412755 RepID=X1Q848_9ZZZZ